jgi:hypothetical protein
MFLLLLLAVVVLRDWLLRGKWGRTDWLLRNKRRRRENNIHALQLHAKGSVAISISRSVPAADDGTCLAAEPALPSLANISIAPANPSNRNRNRTESCRAVEPTADNNDDAVAAAIASSSDAAASGSDASAPLAV